MCVREWTLAQRCFDDGGQHMALDSSAPMDIGQVQGAKEKGKKWKGERGQTIPTLVASVGIVASSVTRKPSAGS